MAMVIQMASLMAMVIQMASLMAMVIQTGIKLYSCVYCRVKFQRNPIISIPKQASVRGSIFFSVFETPN